jgi:hypothetical protein
MRLPELGVKWAFTMPEEGKPDHIEKLLTEQKALEHRRQTLIADLLKQREIALQEFDAKLAKLGYVAPKNSGKGQRSHHKKPAAPPAERSAKPK